MTDQLTLAKDLIGVVAAEEVMRFDRAVPDVHFALPAHPTVKQQLEYFSRYVDTRNEPMYLRLWHSAQSLISEWECAALPDLHTDLDQITDPNAATAIMWAGNAVLSYMNDLDALPKAL
jgi:hypothetical protein